MEKLLLSLFLSFILSIPALGQNETDSSATNLDLLCTLKDEFETGSPALNTNQLNQLEEDCEEPLRVALSRGNRLLVRGYTNEEEWLGCTNYEGRENPLPFWCNQSRERTLEEQRAYNAYSFFVVDSALALPGELFFYTGTAGENKKTVKVFEVPQGMTENQLRQIIQEEHDKLHEEHKTIIEYLKRAEERDKDTNTTAHEVLEEVKALRDRWYRNPKGVTMGIAESSLYETLHANFGYHWDEGILGGGEFGVSVEINYEEDSLFVLERGNLVRPEGIGGFLEGKPYGGSVYLFVRPWTLDLRYVTATVGPFVQVSHVRHYLTAGTTQHYFSYVGAEIGPMIELKLVGHLGGQLAFTVQHREWDGTHLVPSRPKYDTQARVLLRVFIKI